jgi:predicted nicotinamide N-methyase
MFLALPWRKYSVHELIVNNQRIRLQEKTNDPSGTGLIVWDGAFVLAKFLECQKSEQLKNGVVLELGCGTGLAGICCGALNAKKIYLTDLEYVLPNLTINCELNRFPNSKYVVKELDWFHPEQVHSLFEKDDIPDFIIAADVAWVLELVPALVHTIRIIADLCKQTGKVPEIFIAHQTRSIKTDELLFTELRAKNFRTEQIASDEYSIGYDAVPIYRVIDEM